MAKKQIERERKKIGVGGIAVKPERLRALRPETVDELAKSMTAVGLLQPITVIPRLGRGNGYWLVAGRHRLAAAKKLKWPSIACTIFNIKEADEAELAEVDENLCRADLSAAERAMHIKRRKELYEAMHPVAKHGGDRKSAETKNQNLKTENLTTFVKDTAKATGKSRANVARDVTRGKRLGDDLERIKGTSLDKGVELDALAKMTPEQRQPIIEQAVAGEIVTAISPTLVQPPDDNESALIQARQAFYSAWVDASDDERKAYRDECPRDYFPFMDIAPMPIKTFEAAS